MSQEQTDAELAGWARGFVAFLESCNALQDRFIPSPESIENMRSIASRLERPAVFKRFWLFAFNNYYPAGGLGDMVDEYDTLDEAVRDGVSTSYDHWEVLDLETNKVVADTDSHRRSVR